MTYDEAIGLLSGLPVLVMKLRDFPDGGYLEALNKAIDAMSSVGKIYRRADRKLIGRLRPKT